MSTIASLKSHPPPKEEAWERFKWEFKHNYGYRVISMHFCLLVMIAIHDTQIQEKLKPIKDFLLPYWQHPAFVKQRKRAKYILNRITKRTIPIFTGEYAPSEISSYQGTTGFTSAPPTASDDLCFCVSIELTFCQKDQTFQASTRTQPTVVLQDRIL